MKKIVVILFLILIRLSPGFSQTLSIKSPEALQILVRKTAPDTNRLNVFLQLSEAYFLSDKKKTSDLDSALIYTQKALALSKVLKNSRKEAESCLLMARIFTQLQQWERGKSAAEKAVAIYRKHGPNKKLAESYMVLVEDIETYGAGIDEILGLCEMAATIFHDENDKKSEAATLKKWGEMISYQGKVEQAIKKLNQSLAIYKALGYEQVQDLYSLLGVMYTQIGNYNEGLKYGLLALKTAERFHDTSPQMVDIYTYLAVTYGKLDQSDRALVNIKKAFEVAKKGNDIPKIIMLASNIANLNLRLNKPQETIDYLKTILENYPNVTDRYALAQINANFLHAYLLLKDYRTAEIYCKKLMALSAQYAPADPDQLVVYPIACKYFIATAQYKKAEKCLPAFKEICEKNNLVAELKVFHLIGFRLDSSQGKFRSAIAHYQTFKKLSDTLVNAAKSKQYSQLQIQYETDKKDNNIRLLTEQGLLQKSQLQQASLVSNVTFAGVAFLLIILTLIYAGYLAKQKANDKLKTKQEEIDHKNKSLENLLVEKEWLLKEVHHRVKNNLQTVMSLLNSQSAYLHNDAALQAIRDSQHRVQAMSLIHQKLYNSENLSTIEMPVYIHELIEYMHDCFSTAQRIRFELNIDPLELDVSQAVPVGLILNEAITNAIKYAFPQNREGVIKITLQRAEKNQYLLSISDNGVGIPDNFDAVKPGSLGLSLIKGLSQDLDGCFMLERKSGTTLKILFVPDALIK